MPVRHRRSNRQRSVSGREPTPTARPVTRLALPTSPPHRRTPKLLATRPSFVTRYRPPAPRSHPPAHTAPPSAAVQEPTDQPEITVSLCKLTPVAFPPGRLRVAT